MGKMKANRKFIKGEEAVSAVIGVILMVAITVAIAATVYVYVSGMLPTGGSAVPSMAMTQVTAATLTSGNKWVNFTVDSASSSAKWSDLRVYINQTLVTSTPYNGIPSAWTTTRPNPCANYTGAGTPIKANDWLIIHSNALAEGATITIVHAPSNSKIITKTIN